jgi:hypothetical protein
MTWRRGLTTYTLHESRCFPEVDWRRRIRKDVTESGVDVSPKRDRLHVDITARPTSTQEGNRRWLNVRADSLKRGASTLDAMRLGNRGGGCATKFPNPDLIASSQTLRLKFPEGLHNSRDVGVGK